MAVAGETILSATDTVAASSATDTTAASAAVDTVAASAATDTVAVGDGKDKTTGAPESYADFTIPEGVELIPEALDEFKGIAKDMKMSQADAQRLVDFQTKFMKGQTESQTAAFKAMSDGWANATKTDTEIGGSKLNENVAAAGKVIKEFGTPELVSALNTSGLGNHPEVVRIFAKIGKMMTEDGVISGKSAAERPKSVAQIIYPDMN